MGLLSDSDTVPSAGVSPEDTAPFWKLPFQHWLGPLLTAGCKKHLEDADVPDAPSSVRAEHLLEGFERFYYSRKQRDEQHPQWQTLSSTQKQQREYHRVVAAIFQLLGWKFMLAGVTLKPLWLGCNIAQVILLRQLVDYVNDMQTMDMPIWHGALYALGLGLSAAFNSYCQNWLFVVSVVQGIKARAALTAACYKKALRLHSSAMIHTTAGALVNLANGDTQRVQEGFTFFHFLWAGFMEVAVVMGMLFREIGVAAAAGCVVVVCLTPVQIWFGRYVGRYRRFAVRKTDERCKRMNEILNGIQIIKFYAWEDSFRKAVEDVRAEEVSIYRRSAVVKSLNAATFLAAPLIAAVSTFVTNMLQGNSLSPGTAFACLAWFNVMMRTLTMVPRGAQSSAEARVGFQRLGAFLSREELDTSSSSLLSERPLKTVATVTETVVPAVAVPITHNSQGIEMKDLSVDVDLKCGSTTNQMADCKEPLSESPVAVSLQNVTCWWEKPTSEQNSPILRNVTFRIDKQALIAIVGPVASGKSSLLSCLLGETYHSGIDSMLMQGVNSDSTVVVNGRISYVPQQAWILNGSVKNNILFGEPFDAERYKAVVHACCLTEDINSMPGKDESEIGEKGITLSGGQKQRLSLARACYRKADIYLLDDVLSALDAKVARYVFDNVISNTNGFLRDKTRLFVTHAVWCLDKVDSVLALGQGQVMGFAPYGTLRERGVSFELLALEDEEEDQITELESPSKNKSQKMMFISQPTGLALGEEGTQGSNQVFADKLEPSKEDTQETAGSAALMIKEERTVGRVAWGTYKAYMRAGGGYFFFFCIFFAFSCSQVDRVLCDWWLSNWSQQTYANINQSEYAAGYGAFVGFYTVMILARSLMLTFGMLNSSRALHNSMFAKIVRGSMKFFWTTPTGRILNRFSKDMDQIDDLLINTCMDLFNFIFIAAGALFSMVVIIPWFLIALVPLMTIFTLATRFFLLSSRQLKRLESTSRSPMYQYFSESLQGLHSIRAYDAQTRFTRRFIGLQNANSAYYYYLYMAGRWLSIRLDLISATFVFVASLCTVLLSRSIGPGLTGVALTQSLQMSGIFQYAVRQAAEAENIMTSAERIVEYSKTETERPAIIEDNRPAPNWPSMGHILFENVVMKYQPHLPPALKAISFEVKGGQRVGVIGRTGSGKSSLGFCLFRMVEATSGRVVIDGLDISTIGLKDLRSRLSLIPQDPLLFAGTLRFNLDPFHEHSDVKLLEVLRTIQLISPESTGAVDDTKLDPSAGERKIELQMLVSENGENFSVGQRQLLCLGRSLLRQSKILLLDEATANVDNKTDAIIQTSIRREFKNCTVLTIAHRLNTIIDSDLVLVMNQGVVAEFDSPVNLLDRTDSAFTSLIQETGSASATQLRQQAAAALNRCDESSQ